MTALTPEAVLSFLTGEKNASYVKLKIKSV
jgi:hypothetical protein